jgi:hypothetical protein
MADLPQPDKLLQIVSMAASSTAVLFTAGSEAQDNHPAPGAVAGGRMKRPSSTSNLSTTP